jgi:hypothetical protein
MVGNAAGLPRRLGQTCEVADVRAGAIETPAQASLYRRTTQVSINSLLLARTAAR